MLSEKIDAQFIRISNAKIHNLKNISCKIPLGKTTILIGPSGSGKSSLAISTILSEGNWRIKKLQDLSEIYLPIQEDLNSTASIANLPPCYGITKRVQPSKIETVASTLGIDLILGELFANSSFKKCHFCDENLALKSIETVIDQINKEINDNNFNSLTILSSLKETPKYSLKEQMNNWIDRGYETFIIDGLETREFLNSLDSAYVILDKLSWNEANFSLAEESKKWIPSLINSLSGIISSGSIILKNEKNKNLQIYYSKQGFCNCCLNIGIKTLPQHFLLKLSAQSKDLKVKKIFDEELINSIWTHTYIDSNYKLSFEIIIKTEISLLTERLQIEASRFVELINIFKILSDLGLGHLTLERSLASLSTGEYQRIRLARALYLKIRKALLVIEEPSHGLHPLDIQNLIKFLNLIKLQQNTLLIEDNHPNLIDAVDHVIKLGPASGINGGNIVSAGDPDQNQTTKVVKNNKNLHTQANEKITLKGLSLNNLKIEEISFPLNNLISVSGVSGSGKSSLIIKTLYPLLKIYLKSKTNEAAQSFNVKYFEVPSCLTSLRALWESETKDSTFSTVATYSGLSKEIRKILSGTILARSLGLKPIDFSLQNKKSNSEIYRVRYLGFSILDFNQMTVSELASTLENHKKIQAIFNNLKKVNLDYLPLEQANSSLSSGELQRLKIATTISTSINGTLYIFDEPTSGLSKEEVILLISFFQEIISKGNSIIAIEHNETFLTNSDYIIDLGPGAGSKGGNLIFAGFN